MSSRKHNPENRAWRGRSYKKGGRNINELKDKGEPMSNDPTEEIRRQEQAELNARAADRKRLEEEYGKAWDTQELQAEFSVVGFMAPYVVVIRKADNVKGSLQFQHLPRFYFNFVAD